MSSPTPERMAEIREQFATYGEIGITATAWLLDEVSRLRADAERIDWLEQHAMRDDFEDRAGIRIERFTGSPEWQFNDACFRLREWGDTPLDRDGELDYSQRLYRQSDHATLRGAIDTARAAQPLATAIVTGPSGPKE